MSDFKPVILFASTRDAIKAEKIAHTSGIKFKLIPVPKSISSECGICITADKSDINILIDLFESASIFVKSENY